jgi:hypothetical protein
MKDFLDQKTRTNKKPLTEAEVLNRLRDGTLILPPATLRFVDPEPYARSGKPDGVLDARWADRTCRYVFEYKSLNTPKAITGAVAMVARYAADMDLRPLIIVPYLSEERLAWLEEEGVSGLDLAGNGMLLAPSFAIWRSGEPNRFTTSQPIKNVFRGSSSLFARCFLLRSKFAGLSDIRSFALSKLEASWPSTLGDTKLTPSTASKVVQALQEEMIVTKDSEGIRLLTPQALIEQLRTNYTRPRGTRLEGKAAVAGPAAWLRLRDAIRSGRFRCVATGVGSAARYGVLSGPDRLSVYVTDLKAAAEILGVESSRVFPNIELIEEKGDAVYFDVRDDGDVLWASPIQTWLELSVAGPRERAAAKVLEMAILEGRAEDLL